MLSDEKFMEHVDRIEELLKDEPPEVITREGGL